MCICVGVGGYGHVCGGKFGGVAMCMCVGFVCLCGGRYVLGVCMFVWGVDMCMCGGVVCSCVWGYVHANVGVCGSQRRCQVLCSWN